MKDKFDPDKLVRPNIRAMKPYSSARDEYQGSSGIFLDANENPFGKLNRYPDPYQRELKKKVSEIKGIPAENIFLGNGSDEIIDLSFRIFCTPGTDKALTFSPTYGMYEVSAEANDVKMIRLPLDNEFQIVFSNLQPYLSDNNLKIIFICTPNNPTGNSFNRKTIERIIEEFRGIVIIDEAYGDFSDEPSFRKDIFRYPNLVVLQTFSKAYGMAAVRVGMAFAGEGILKYYNKLKPPYNISSVNQAAVIKSLGKKEKFNNEVTGIRAERERLRRALEANPLVISIFPSDSNFLLVKVKDPDLIYKTLVERNIIVRNRNSVVSGCLRITVGTPTENTRLINALKKIKL